ncbi:MAG: sodium:calcium antiporter [Pseudorhodoplanes sp.]|nr:MAG: sodium:calcium antiporter [Pseudorhodoplanes sp.]
MTAAWIKFLICAGIITVAGAALTRYGDLIARRTGLSRNWIGLALLATATSLPELFTGISAVTIVNAPNIAVGDALGSCVFNLAMFVVLDLMHRQEPMYGRVDQAHILTAGFGIILIGFVGASLLLWRDGPAAGFRHIGAYTPIIMVLYFVAMRAAFVYQQRIAHIAEAADAYPHVTLPGAIARYLAAAICIAAAGTWLPFIGVELADVMGWRTTFVGTLFIAAATSLPEVVVTISALRLGALDMAMANLLGSNLFNVVVIAIDDIAYLRGPLLSSVSPVHGITAFAATIMSGIVIVALLYRPVTRLRGTIGWISLSLLLVYLLSSYAIFLHGH